MDRSIRWAVWGQWFAAAALLLIVTQSGYLLFQGESYCPTASCKIVEEQSPIPPLFMNAGGLVFFAVLLALFMGARRHGTGLAAGLLTPLLLAGIAAEGVLFAFQYQMGYFCVYCCIVLALIVLLNALLGAKQGVRALLVFGAVFLAAVLLMVPKGLTAAPQPVSAGTLAHRVGQTGAEERYFFFSEDCTHCKAALAALMQDRHATLRLNPLAPLKELKLPGLEQNPGFNPEANRAFLAGLGIDTVPVLLVRQHGGMRIFLGENQIIGYVQAATQSKIPEGISGQSQSSSAPQTDFLAPESDGCSVDLGCSQ